VSIIFADVSGAGDGTGEGRGGSADAGWCFGNG